MTSGFHAAFNPPYSFKTADEFFEYKCELQPLALKLREFIKLTYPNLIEKKAFGCPFYSLKKNVCFLVYRKDGNYRYKNLNNNNLILCLGLYHGNQMFDTKGLFLETKHASVKYIKITENLELDDLRDYIEQGIDLAS